MPYIKQHQRLRLVKEQPGDAGELAYELARTMEVFLEQITARHGSLRFGDLAHVLGALDAVRLEFFRRVVAPYEKRKCAENGDVWAGTIRTLGISEV